MGAATRIDEAPARATRLTFKGGGYVLLGALLLVGAVVAYRLSIIREALSWRGDQPPPPSLSNGFDLATATVPVRLIGLRRHRDGMSTLDDLPALPVAGLAHLNRKRWTKLLVDDDLVIGVAMGGEARAYPVRVLNWHEIANDTVGGIPIAATWCPMSGSAVVYDRRRGDHTMTLGMSGMIYNNNLLFYDRAGDTANLWSQVSGRAVVGPAAQNAERLEALPCQLLPWSAWLAQHPDTTFIAGYPEHHGKQYRSDPFIGYPVNDQLYYPVEPRLDPDTDPPKEPVVLVRVGTETRLFRTFEVAEAVDPGGSWTTHVGNAPVTFQYWRGRNLVQRSWPVVSRNPEALTEVRFMYRMAYESHLGPRAP